MPSTSHLKKSFVNCNLRMITFKRFDNFFFILFVKFLIIFVKFPNLQVPAFDPSHKDEDSTS